MNMIDEMNEIDELTKIIEPIVKHDVMWLDDFRSFIRITTLERVLRCLKNYRDRIYKLELFDTCQNVKKTLDGNDNPPLTWDELAELDKKPVWVEGVNGKMWGIIVEFYKDMFGDGKVTLRTGYYQRLHLNQSKLGNTWNAYRKERV